MKTTNLLAKERVLDNNLTLKLKSENSYKVTDTITAKLNLENEFKNGMSGYKHNTLVNYKESEKDVKDIIKEETLESTIKNTASLKAILNYTKQIDSKNKFVVEPSLKFEMVYEKTKNNIVKDVTKNTDTIKSTYTDEASKTATYNLIPRIEATYENKVTDKFTFALKPFIELKFSGNHTLNNESTFQITASEKMKDKVENNLIGISNTEEEKAIKESALKGKKVVKVRKGTDLSFGYSNISAGAKLEFNYAW